MVDMARRILGEDGGEIAILSASPDAANQNIWIADFEEVLADPANENLVLVDTVYGNDQSEESYNQALALLDQHPDLELIMAPTTVGIAAAAKAMQDEGLCETVKVAGLGLACRDGRVHREWLCSRVRSVELRRPRLRDVLRDVRNRDRPDRSRRRRHVRGRSDGHVHDRSRPDPRSWPSGASIGPFDVYNIDNIAEAAGPARRRRRAGTTTAAEEATGTTGPRRRRRPPPPAADNPTRPSECFVLMECHVSTRPARNTPIAANTPMGSVRSPWSSPGRDGERTVAGDRQGWRTAARRDADRCRASRS